jgi:hypothetical protein
MGLFIFEADNVVKTNLLMASMPGQGIHEDYIYIDGIWSWTQNEEKLTVTFPFDSGGLRFEFDSITNITMTGNVTDDGVAAEAAELNRLR